MTALAPHLTAFFHERLAVERNVSPNTRESYAYAFKLLLCYVSKRLSRPLQSSNLNRSMRRW